MYRNRYEKEINDNLIRRHLNVPVDIRTRKDMKEALQKSYR